MHQTVHRVEQFRSMLPGIRAMTLRSDRAFPRHTHNQFGIGVITQGAHRSWSGVGPVEAVAGDIITSNPGEMHDGLPVAGEIRVRRMLYFDPDLVAGAICEETATEPEIERPVLHDPHLATLFGRLFAMVPAQLMDPLGVQQNLLLLLVRAVSRRPGKTEQAMRANSAKSQGVERARARLDDAPEVPTSLEDLASVAGMSRFQLIRAFAREVGATPHAYLIQRRVCLVQQMLASGHTAAEAAASAGFADQSHMSRAFVRQIGTTPGKYQAVVS